MTYIRTKDEAMDALGETLALPERRQQIIDVNVKIILCLHPEARTFMSDCLEGLIGGGLDEMTRKKLDALDALPGEDVVVIVNPEADRLYESVARALDALHIAGVSCDVFPVLAAEVDRWQIARAIILNEQGVRECVIEGLRARGSADQAHRAEFALKTLRLWIEQSKPAWIDRLPVLRAAVTSLPMGELALHVIAADDTHAAPFLELLERDAVAAADFVSNFMDMLQTLRRLEAESGRPTDSKSFRRVA
jgi:hypothetical protein